MINFKKIGIGLCMSAIGAAMITSTVSAHSLRKDYDYEQEVIDGSDNKTIDVDEDSIGFIGTPEEYERIYDDCLIEDPFLYFEDTSLIQAVYDQLDAGNDVADLELMANYLNEGLTDGQGHMFINGIFATDDFEDPTYIKYICKCTPDEYRNFILKTDPYANEDNVDGYMNCLGFSVKLGNTMISASYNRDIHELTYTEYYL